MDRSLSKVTERTNGQMQRGPPDTGILLCLEEEGRGLLLRHAWALSTPRSVESPLTKGHTLSDSTSLRSPEEPGSWTVQGGCWGWGESEGGGWLHSDVNVLNVPEPRT